MPGKDDHGNLVTKFARAPWYPANHNLALYFPDGQELLEGEDDTQAFVNEQGIPEVGILDLDEFGQAEDDIKKACADLLLYGKCGESILPRGWRVVAASNRMADRAGVARSLTFLVNRRCQHNIDASLPAWIDWANSQSDELRPHYLTMSFAQKNPDLVFRDAVPPGNDPFCTPRTLCLMDFELRALRSDADIQANKLPLDAGAREVCAGWIGKAEAAQFFTHLKYADELPDYSEIVTNPDRAKLPSTRDAQMVAGYMLAHAVGEKDASQMLKYMSRMQIEMQVLTMRAVMAQSEKHPDRVSAVMDTKEAGMWFGKHKDLLIASRS
jgi:hypothetical protein